MPISRRRTRTRRTHRFGRRQRQQYGPRLGRAPRWGRRMRVGQNLTRDVKWFKSVVAVTSDNAGRITRRFPTGNVEIAGDFNIYGVFYEEFKVITMIVKLFPANVGGESVQTNQGPNPSIPVFQRGDICSWVDQLGDDPLPAGIDDVINRSSCRLFQPRRYHKRYVNRPRDYPGWGKVNDSGVITTEDPWNCAIRLYGDNFTPISAPGQQNFFWAQIMYKVLYRNKRE